MSGADAETERYSIAEAAQAFGIAVSALRYYDEIGLVRCAERRGGVRYYDRAALARLVYAQLWHEDGMLPIAETRAIMESEHAADRLRLIAEQRDALRERAARMQQAAAVLDHMLGCPRDDPFECPQTGAYLFSKIDHALAGREFEDDFLPKAHV